MNYSYPDLAQWCTSWLLVHLCLLDFNRITRCLRRKHQPQRQLQRRRKATPEPKPRRSSSERHSRRGVRHRPKATLVPKRLPSSSARRRNRTKPNRTAAAVASALAPVKARFSAVWPRPVPLPRRRLSRSPWARNSCRRRLRRPLHSALRAPHRLLPSLSASAGNEQSYGFPNYLSFFTCIKPLLFIPNQNKLFNVLKMLVDRWHLQICYEIMTYKIYLIVIHIWKKDRLIYSYPSR